MTPLSVRTPASVQLATVPFAPGDLVIPRTGYPILCEVLNVEEDGRVSVRGLLSPPGVRFSFPVSELSPASKRLLDN